MDSGPLPGDFYSYEQLLSDPERETVARLSEFLRAEVAPSKLLRGIVALDPAHADASVSTFFGVHTGLALV